MAGSTVSRFAGLVNDGRHFRTPIGLTTQLSKIALCRRGRGPAGF